MKRLTQTEFLAKAVAAHGAGRYDYSQTVFKGADNKISVVCPKHGAFWQLASSHTAKKAAGCPKCKGETLTNIQLLSTEQFIERAHIVHGCKYNYSRAKYLRMKLSIEIDCPKHGAFKQEAGKHLAGSGCYGCAAEARRQSKLLNWTEQSNGRLATLYFIKLSFEGEEFYKVGITYLSVEQRYRSKERLGGYDYELLAIHKSANSKAVADWEQSILETFAHLRYKPKRPFGGETECFSEAEPILAIFPL